MPMHFRRSLCLAALPLLLIARSDAASLVRTGDRFKVSLDIFSPTPRLAQGSFTVIRSVRGDYVVVDDISIDTGTISIGHTMGDHLRLYHTDPNWQPDPEDSFMEEHIAVYEPSSNALCCNTWITGGDMNWSSTTFNGGTDFVYYDNVDGPHSFDAYYTIKQDVPAIYMNRGFFVPISSSTPNAAEIRRFDSQNGVFIGTPVTSPTVGEITSTTIGPDGNIYVAYSDGASHANGRVLRFTLDGQFIDTFVPPGSGGLSVPTGLTFGPHGNLYVSNSNGNVLQFDANTGSFLRVFISNIVAPEDLAFGPDESLYVSSGNTNTVAKFWSNGARVDTFSLATGAVSGPRGLAFGLNGDLFVAGSLSNNIGRFDSRTGTLVRTIALDSEVGAFQDVAFGPDGNLYALVDYDNATRAAIVRFTATTNTFIDEFVPPALGAARFGGGMLFVDSECSRWPPGLDTGCFAPNFLLALKDDKFTTATDSSANLDVLRNDSVFSEPLTLGVFSAPSHGTATVLEATGAKGNLRISYTPTSGFAGIDSLTYVVQAGGEAGGTEVKRATVQIEVMDDPDGDGVNRPSDNCLSISNASQRDTDSDGYGNACDADLNNSGGVVNFADLAIFRSMFGTTNPNGDFNGTGGVVNFSDLATFRSLFGRSPGPSSLAP